MAAAVVGPGASLFASLHSLFYIPCGPFFDLGASPCSSAAPPLTFAPLSAPLRPFLFSRPPPAFTRLVTFHLFSAPLFSAPSLTSAPLPPPPPLLGSPALAPPLASAFPAAPAPPAASAALVALAPPFASAFPASASLSSPQLLHAPAIQVASAALVALAPPFASAFPASASLLAPTPSASAFHTASPRLKFILL
jgi:hypothetical protein